MNDIAEEQPMHVRIIGTHHDLQLCDSKDRGLLCRINSAAERYGDIMLVAEEIKCGANAETFGRQLIRDKYQSDDRWLSVDMDCTERKAANIYDELRQRPDFITLPGASPVRAWCYLQKADSLREKHWVKKIQDKCRDINFGGGLIVITCGIIHIPFLAEKLILAEPNYKVSCEIFTPLDSLGGEVELVMKA